MTENIKCITFEVECVSEELCRNCEELEIDINKTMLYADYETVGCENYLYCTHAQLCRRLLNYLKKAAEKQDEQRQEEI